MPPEDQQDTTQDDETSAFDPETFMQTEVEEAMEVNFVPVPAADYMASIDKVVARSAKGYPMLDVFWKIHDPELAESLGLEEAIVKQGLFLDLSAAGKILLGPNKNVSLGRIREAVGQNLPGSWSPQMLTGAGPCMISVTVGEKDAEGNAYNDVKKVVAAS